MTLLLRLVTFFLIIPLSLSATERSFNISSDFSECDSKYNEANVITEYANFKYDDVKQELYVDVSFSSTSGTPANFFQFGINSEKSLNNNAYRLPYFYVDAYNKSAIPKVSAFIFNRDLQGKDKKEEALAQCNNKYPSYDTEQVYGGNKTEAILVNTTNNNGNPSYVLNANFATSTIANKTINTFNLILDMSQISAFDPMGPNNGSGTTTEDEENFRQSIWNGNNFQSTWYSNRWKDFDFKDKISIDFVPSLISTLPLYAENQLTELEISDCSFCRIREQNTNQTPTCTIEEQQTSPKHNIEAVYKFIVDDAEDENDRYYVEFSGLDDNIETTPTDSLTLLAPEDQNIATLKWTPTFYDQGKTFEITARFIQDYGTINAVSNTCKATVTVNTEITCQEISITESRNQILSNNNKVRGILTKLNKQNLKLAKRLKSKNPTNYHTDIESISNETYNYIFELPQIFNVCTANPNKSITPDDYFDNYLNHQNKFKNLYCDTKVTNGCSGYINNVGVKLLREYKKRKIKVLIKTKNISKKEAKIKANRFVTRKKKLLRKLIKANRDSVDIYFTTPGNHNYTLPNR